MDMAYSVDRFAGCQKIKNYGDDQKTPKQWKKFLACGQNKENLLESFFQHWSTSAKNIIDNTRITVGHGGKCHIIKMNGTYTDLKVLKVKGLETIHEEADTRFMQHAAHAAKNNRHLVIKSPDTDVFVLALAFCSQINGHLYFHTIKTETHALFTPTQTPHTCPCCLNRTARHIGNPSYTVLYRLCKGPIDTFPPLKLKGTYYTHFQIFDFDLDSYRAV